MDAPSKRQSSYSWSNPLLLAVHRVIEAKTCDALDKMVLQAIRYYPARESSAASLEILDQLALPHRSIYLSVNSCEDAWNAIKQMKVRGAPAIAIVAALSLAVELSRARTTETKAEAAQSAREFIWNNLEYLKSSRPTAVNLADAVGKLKATAEKAEKVDGADGHAVANSYITAAEKMLIDDVKDNEAIGKHGAKWIRENTKAGSWRGAGKGDLKVMTHCNTGWVRSRLRCSISANSRALDHLQQLVMVRRLA